MEIREATFNDYDSLVEFWNQCSGWDIISRETWEERFVNSPLGSSVIFITEKDKSIIAQVIFIRSIVIINDRLVNACRPFAAIVDKSVKGLTGFRFITQIYNFAIKILSDKGFDLLFIMPDPRWKPLSRLIKVEVADFPLYRKDILPLLKAKKNSDIKTIPMDFDNNDINDLWDAAKKLHLNMVVRNKQMLKWKNSHRNYQLIGVYNKGILIGIIVYIEKMDENQIQICDILYREEGVLNSILEEMSNYLNNLYSGNSAYKKMVILVTKNLKEKLEENCFIPDDYHFVFGIKRLNKSISKEALNISNWYLSAND